MARFLIFSKGVRAIYHTFIYHFMNSFFWIVLASWKPKAIVSTESSGSTITDKTLRTPVLVKPLVISSPMDENFRKLKRTPDGTWDAVESDKGVFEGIMFRLPVRSILRSKSVSKLWYNVMSTKYFIMLHRNWSKKKAKFFVFYDTDFLEMIDREMHLMEPNGAYSESYTIPCLKHLHNLSLIASFNGLICCINDVTPTQDTFQMEIRICNPATREVLVLPSSHLSFDIPIFGVWYSNKYHFYKVYKFFSDPVDLKKGYSCEVYSSKTREWKVLGRFARHLRVNPFCLSLISNHVCINEKLYWFLSDDDEDEFDMPTSILMVDMDDKFMEIPLPTCSEIAFLIEFEGQLCFVNWTGLKFYLWLYDEKQKGWYPLDVLKFPVPWMEVAHFDSVTAHENEILFVYKDVEGFRHELLYDVDYAMWKDFHIAEDAKDKSIAVFPFFETLLPCDSHWE